MLRVGVLPALLWKHGVVRYRRWILTLVEIVVPLLPLLGLLYFYHKTGGNGDNRKMALTPQHTEYLPISNLQDDRNIRAIYFAPNTSLFTRDLMTKAAKQLDVYDVQGFATEYDLLLSKGKQLQIFHQDMAVIFQNITGDEIPQRLFYTIRNTGMYNTDRIVPRLQVAGPHEQYGHVYYLFVALKAHIDSTYIDMRASKVLDIVHRISIQAFPYPAYDSDEMWWIKYVVLIPTMILLGVMAPLLIIVIRVMSDKVTGIKELMKMMGVRLRLLWLSHYINCWVALIPVAVIFLVLLVAAPIGHTHLSLVPLSSPLIVFISLLLYINYVILFAFGVTTIFSKGLAGCIVGAMLWIVSPVLVVKYMKDVSTLVAIFFTFIPNYPLYSMFFNIGLYEIREEGLHWSNLFSVTPEFPLSCGIIWLMLLVQEALLALFIWYMDQVNPGPYGVAKSLTFPLKRILKRVSPDPPIDLTNEEGDMGLECHLEPPPQDAEVGIVINNVWKVYKGRRDGKKAALKGVSMNLYTGGITVLLGHNGAGKTTLMSIITGLTSATAGYVELKGEGGIGLCPQHNLTFPDLTLHQHLMLFGLLKGLTIEESDKEARSVAESLQLTEKLTWLCGKLSGGQRRRTQLGLALMGHPRTLILDEPTTGLDPVSRRQLWDILLDIRNKHTILITSHLMEEADVLADRVAIIDHGRLKCLGTPIFLKKTFSTGYTVKVLTHGDEHIEREIKHLVTSSGAEIEVLPREGTLLSFRLLSHHTHLLPTLFNNLEKNKQRLDITSIGLSLTTLEEVFLRVTEGCVPVQETLPMTIIDVEEGTESYLHGLALMFSQFFALFVKKVIYLVSVKKSLLLQIALSLLMFLSPLLGSEEDDVIESPPLVLTPNILTTGPQKLLYSTPSEFTPPLMSLASYYNLHLQETSDAYNGILAEGEKDPKLSYMRSLQMGLGTVGGTICGLYSTSIYHTLPVVTGLLTNLMATLYLPGEPPHIVTTNHPISKESLTSMFDDDLQPYDIISWVTSAVLGYFFLLGIFLSLPVRERIGGQRHLQQLAGPGPFTYWLATLITDIALLLPLSTIFFMVTTHFHPAEAMKLSHIAVPILSLGWLHILASLCFIYALSLLFNSPAGAYITYLILTLFIGVLISTGAYFASVMSDDSDDDGMGIITGLMCLLIPSYPLSQGLISVAMLSKENTYCLQMSAKLKLETPCCGKKDGQCIGLGEPFTHETKGVSTYLIFLAVSAVLYMTILLLVEYKVIARIWESIINRSYQPLQTQAADEEVQRERKKVKEEVGGIGDAETSQVLVHKLYKRYRKHPFTQGHEAVKDLSFSIQKGECFGLLGANGAGKSTTFNILAGIQVPTKGACYFKGKTKPSLGYCPQFDALDHFLTGNQVLELFCRLRGVSPKLLSSKVTSMLRSAALTEYGGVPCGHYSGGTRRRLSTVVALGAAHYGGDCVLLDEPSAGVDPHSRQSLHALIQEARARGHCIVLSSHSMEECDKLVSRLGILRRGELACLGMPQHLKHKYSSGYLLTLRLRPKPRPSPSEDVVDSPTIENMTQLVTLQPSRDLCQLRNSVKDSFSCTLKDEHLTVLQYHIEDRNCSYSTMFTRMEELKSRHESILEDYTISDTTLEQVFLSLTRESDDGGV